MCRLLLAENARGRGHSLASSDVLAARAVGLPEQAVVGERGDALEDVDAGVAGGARHGLRRRQGEAADEHGESAKERLLLRAQQVDRRTEHHHIRNRRGNHGRGHRCTRFVDRRC